MTGETFFWGVATSAYQAEGGYNDPGGPRTNWADAEARGDVEKCGSAADFWHRYAEDFARCRAMGLNAFRLGLEWTRTRTLDPSALDHYAAILNSCRTHGLEPIVTLHHFVHPAELGTDPWLDPGTPDVFAGHVRSLIAEITPRLTAPLHWFITINEPNMLALNSYLGRQFPARGPAGFRTITQAYNQLLRAHLLAYRGLHSLYAERGWPRPQVTFNNYCSDLYWSDKLLLDLVSARERRIPRASVGPYIRGCAIRFAHSFRDARLPLRRDLAYRAGAIFKWIANWLGHRRFRAEDFAPLLDTLYAGPHDGAFDYIGLDYYDPFAAHAFRWPVLWDHEFKNRSFRSWMLATVTSKWWDWRVLPRGLHFFCRCYAEDFQRQVLIAENGMAIRRRRDNQGVTPRRDRMTRSQFLRLHVHEVERIVDDGIPLIGYLHWSLFDNYEWGSFTPRFGLYALDYPNGLERVEADPWGDRPAETYALLIQKARRRTATRRTTSGNSASV